MKSKTVCKRSVSDFPLIIFLFGITALLVFTSLSCGRKKEEPPPREMIRPVKMMTVTGAGTESTRTYPGVVRASKRVDLAFRVSGPLTEVTVDEGQTIKKGQLIARILPRDFETAIAKAKADALQSEQQFNRYQDLYVKKQVSKADFDKYKAENDIAKARLKEAEDALDDTYLRAPFTGVIATRYVENFQDVRAKEPIVSLQDISQVEILVDAPESDMARLKARVKLRTHAEFATAPGKQYELVMKEFSTQADPRTQTYQITLQMRQPDEILVLPGMTASVVAQILEDSSKESRIVVPAVAVFSDESGGSLVWVYDAEAMTAAKREVTTGDLAGADGIVILDGISRGETVVVTAVNQLHEGMKVRPLDQ